MNITYIIGLVLAIFVFLFGVVCGINIGPKAVEQNLPVFTFKPENLWNFFDAASIFIVIGCTFAIVVASFPGSALASIPKHFGVILNAGKFKPLEIIDQLVDLARKIEDFYQKPEDIEWAIVDGQVYLLQSRPITTMK